MPVQDTQSPVRGSAAWIARHASGLLETTPGLQPLDAVRLAMNDATSDAASKPVRQLSRPSARDSHR
jgi:hypothetical protein